MSRKKTAKKAPAKSSAAKKATPVEPEAVEPEAVDTEIPMGTTFIDVEARQALVQVGRLMAELYPAMPSNVDKPYFEFMRMTKEFDRG